MTYSATIRAQVFEVIVRQAIAGAPWREICAGPMAVNNITPESVEAEVHRRLHTGKQALSPESQKSLTEYIAAWQDLVRARKMGQDDEIEARVTSFYKRRRLEKPSIVYCKSPAMMYLHLMLLTGQERVSNDDFSSERSIRAAVTLSQDQSETFKSNLIESIKEVSSRLNAQRSGPGLSWKDAFGNLKDEIFTGMQRALNRDLYAYFTWGFVPETIPFVRRLGTVYDVTTSQLKSIASEFELPGIPPSARMLQETLGMGGLLDQPRVPEQVMPGEVFRFHCACLWEMQQILAPGYVLENLEEGKHFPESVREEITEWLALFKVAPMYAFFENICLVSVYPETVVVDELFRPSTLDGAAITFCDDYKVYAIDGIAVPRKFHEHPEESTIAEIDEVVNVALRRLMIERYGAQRYLMDKGAELIQEDEKGKLYRVEVPDDEPIVMICVTNSTMEPDGTYRQYYLRVPPQTTTAHDGVAWSFGMPGIEYSPEKET